nr:hypothetical protein [uncultured Allomuricauda sp.]
MGKFKNIAKIVFLIATTVVAQSGTDKPNFSEALEVIPQESVYVQYNTGLLFAGEYLKYKLYNFNNDTKKISGLSKIAYVALIGRDGTVIAKQKIRLTFGTGYGDFFIPTSVSTGSYKIVGYTEWMKNFGIKHFFQSDIHIINPYQTTPKSHLKQSIDSSQSTTHEIVNAKHKNGVTSMFEGDLVKVELNKKDFKKRERININISTLNEIVSKGTYGISVRKIDSICMPMQRTSKDFYADFQNGSTTKIALEDSNINLPELRGEIISGVIKEKSSGRPVKNQKISISLPGNDFLFKIATSTDEGKFWFNISEEYANMRAAIQVLSDNWENYEITIDDHQMDYDGLSFGNFVISKEIENFILERSVQNQIENVYREIKTDSIKQASHKEPFYRKYTTVYNLDDFTRFSNLQETIIEVVNQVSIRKLNNKGRVFEIRPEEGLTDTNLQPMVFVDGLFMKRHEDFMDYSAKKIKTISFSRGKYFLGTQLFQGVISFETIGGDFYNDFYAPYIIDVDLFKPQPQKEYHTQDYSGNKLQKRIPDFRHQLLWEPNLDLSDEDKELVFYASDVVGNYELVLEGFTSIGKPVSVKKSFVVR